MNFSNDYCIHIIKIEKIKFQFLYLHFIFEIFCSIFFENLT